MEKPLIGRISVVIVISPQDTGINFFQSSSRNGGGGGGGGVRGPP